MGESSGSPPPALIYNPFLPETKINPYPIYRSLREADPVSFNPYAKIWFLTRHQDCQFVLRDPRFSATLGQEQRVGQEKLPKTMLNTDPPDHMRLRQPFSLWFTPRRLQQFRARIQTVTDRLIDQMATQRGADLLVEFAVPLAVEILSMALDVESADRADFHRWAEQAAVILDPLASTEAQQSGRPGAAALHAYFTQRIALRRQEPGEDFISTLLPTVDEQATITEEELLAGSTLMVVGGYEPLIHVIGNGVYALLRQRAEWQRLQDDPGLLKSAVDEVIRYDSPIQFAARVATADVELAPQTIRQGQTVVMLFGAANRDPAVFPDPDRVDIGRSPNPHLGFGSGAHVCLGAPLVRLGAEVALGSLVQRLPQLALATEAITWRQSAIPRGLTALPVTY